MTTIAYHHATKEIAFDSRLTQGNTIITDKSLKDYTSKLGDRFFLSGASSDCKQFCDEFSNGVKASRDFDCEGFMTSGGLVYVAGCDESTGMFFACEIDFDAACGSGAKFALSAMDFGRSAKQAVRYAATRDSCTGGKIRVVKV